MSLKQHFALLISITLVCVILTIHARKNQRTRTYTIMLNPAGDARHTGRRIDDTFERSVTLQYVEKLKK